MASKFETDTDDAPDISYRDELWLSGLDAPSDYGDAISPSEEEDDGFNDVSLTGFGFSDPVFDVSLTGFDVTCALDSLQVDSDTESILEVDHRDLSRDKLRAAADAETIGMELLPALVHTDQQGNVPPPKQTPAAPASLYSFVHMTSGTRHWCLDPFGRDWVCPVVERTGTAKYRHTTVPAINPHRQTCAVCVRMAKAIPEVDISAWSGLLPPSENPK